MDHFARGNLLIAPCADSRARRQMKSIEICAVNTEANRGGAARIANLLNAEINKLGSDFHSTLYHAGDRNNAKYITGLKRRGSRHLNAALFRYMGSIRSLDLGLSNELIRKARYADLIHIHNLHGYYINYENFMQGIQNKPVFWTWHDMWGATGRCGFSFDCERWRSGCGSCPNMQIYPKTKVDRSAEEFAIKTNCFLNHPNLHVISPSAWLSRIARERGFPAQNVHTIPNPSDLSKISHFERNEARDLLKLKKDETYLLFVAADCGDPRKGYSDFVQIVEKINVKGIAVGIPPSERHKNIIFTGSISDLNLLSAYYSAADVFVITSKIDNYPNTVVESQSLGLPVFGFAVGGIPEQVPEAWDGVVPPEDLALLITRIENYLNTTPANSLKKELIAYAKNTWSPQIVASQYCNLFKQML